MCFEGQQLMAYHPHRGGNGRRLEPIILRSRPKSTIIIHGGCEHLNLLKLIDI